ncbi:hypothetical protein ETH_00000350 [Eimeria tenella]|uniref:Uncharacterized protein n=1 Tax=Eimeria tenella TaxID=5802 RepID=U6KQB2_EIMTE|nr:hypothetical protein ETH_00000350 [Eimeria tenella]CDJ39103.1 hypothetical protein ETH_00000350 [Eimeria tenella]|eukprot:XP_013229858.1 hypothetical protein ETH_00000350 [Eimeria tenella]
MESACRCNGFESAGARRSIEWSGEDLETGMLVRGVGWAYRRKYVVVTGGPPVLSWGNRREGLGLVVTGNSSVDAICGRDRGGAAARRGTGNARLSTSTAYTFVPLFRMRLHSPPLHSED